MVSFNRENIASAIQKILHYTKVIPDGSLGWFSDLLLNNYQMWQTTANGRLDPASKASTPLWTVTDKTEIRDSGSCNKVMFDYTTHTTSIIPASCISDGYELCEASDNPLIAYNMTLTDLKTLAASKFENHPINSVSACSAYCAPSLFYVLDTICSCITSFDASQYEEIAECSHAIPCPGNVLQVCGCIVKSSLTTIYPIVQGFVNPSQGKLAIQEKSQGSIFSLLSGYESCGDLRTQGIFIDGTYELSSGSEDCSLWGMSY